MLLKLLPKNLFILQTDLQKLIYTFFGLK
jgi:hypothetical protein